MASRIVVAAQMDDDSSEKLVALIANSVEVRSGEDAAALTALATESSRGLGFTDGHWVLVSSYWYGPFGSIPGPPAREALPAAPVTPSGQCRR